MLYKRHHRPFPEEMNKQTEDEFSNPKPQKKMLKKETEPKEKLRKFDFTTFD